MNLGELLPSRLVMIHVNYGSSSITLHIIHVFTQSVNKCLFCVNAKHALTLLTGTTTARNSRLLEVCEKRKHQRSKGIVEANWEKSFLKESIVLLL